MNTATTMPSARPWNRWLPWLLVGVVIVAVGCVRFRLRDMPLERDEGEFAYQGQLLLQGIPPYKLAYNMKLPGSSMAYALMMAVFGQSSAGVHLGLLVVNAASIALMYLLGRRLFDSTAGVMAAAAYGTLSTGTKVMGLGAHATHFVVLPMLGAVLCLLHASATGRRVAYFGSGLLFGLAFLMKQHAVFFPIFAGVWICWAVFKGIRPVDWKLWGPRLYLYALGCALPFLLTCVWFWFSGVFAAFWFWTFEYARVYVSEISLSDGMSLFNYHFSRIWATDWPLFIMGAVGLVMLWWKRPARGRDTWLTAFLVFSFLTVCPGLYFRTNYFITLLPAVSLLAGVAVSFLRQRPAKTNAPPIWKHSAIALGAMALALPFWNEREILFTLTPLQACKTIHSLGPFAEAQEVAKYIREHSTQDARVAVIGSEPQIYFYSGRHSATGFIYMYSLVEEHPFALAMQGQLIREVEASEPEFLVFVDVGNSWLTRPQSPQLIFKWMADYCGARYKLVGVASMISPTETVYEWDAAVQNRPRPPGGNLFVLKRAPQK